MALGRQHCRPGCIYSLRPAGIKVRINGSFILFSLQGAGVYVLVPRRGAGLHEGGLRPRGLGRGGAVLSGHGGIISYVKPCRAPCPLCRSCGD